MATGPHISESKDLQSDQDPCTKNLQSISRSILTTTVVAAMSYLACKTFSVPRVASNILFSLPLLFESYYIWKKTRKPRQVCGCTNIVKEGAILSKLRQDLENSGFKPENTYCQQCERGEKHTCNSSIVDNLLENKSPLQDHGDEGSVCELQDNAANQSLNYGNIQVSAAPTEDDLLIHEGTEGSQNGNHSQNLELTDAENKFCHVESSKDAVISKSTTEEESRVKMPDTNPFTMNSTEASSSAGDQRQSCYETGVSRPGDETSSSHLNGSISFKDPNSDMNPDRNDISKEEYPEERGAAGQDTSEGKSIPPVLEDGNFDKKYVVVKKAVFITEVHSFPRNQTKNTDLCVSDTTLMYAYQSEMNKKEVHLSNGINTKDHFFEFIADKHILQQSNDQEWTHTSSRLELPGNDLPQTIRKNLCMGETKATLNGTVLHNTMPACDGSNHSITSSVSSPSQAVQEVKHTCMTTETPLLRFLARPDNKLIMKKYSETTWTPNKTDHKSWQEQAAFIHEIETSLPTNKPEEAYDLRDDVSKPFGGARKKVRKDMKQQRHLSGQIPIQHNSSHTTSTRQFGTQGHSHKPLPKRVLHSDRTTSIGQFGIPDHRKELLPTLHSNPTTSTKQFYTQHPMWSSQNSANPQRERLYSQRRRSRTRLENETENARTVNRGNSSDNKERQHLQDYLEDITCICVPRAPEDIFHPLFQPDTEPVVHPGNEERARDSIQRSVRVRMDAIRNCRPPPRPQFIYPDVYNIQQNLQAGAAGINLPDLVEDSLLSWQPTDGPDITTQRP